MVLLDSKVALAIYEKLREYLSEDNELLEELERAIVDSASDQGYWVSRNDLQVTRDAIIDFLKEKRILDTETELFIRSEFDELFSETLIDVGLDPL